MIYLGTLNFHNCTYVFVHNVIRYLNKCNRAVNKNYKLIFEFNYVELFLSENVFKTMVVTKM